MAVSLSRYIVQLLESDQLRKATDVLLAAAEQLHEELRSEVSLLAGQLSALEKQERSGALTKSARKIERNHLRKALLELAGQIPAGLSLSAELGKRVQKNRLQRVLQHIFTLGLIAAVVVWLLGKQYGFRAGLSLQVDQIGFRMVNPGVLSLTGGKEKEIQLQHFTQVAVTADTLFLDTDWDSVYERRYSLTGDLIIQPLPGVGNTGLRMERANLNEIDLPATSSLRFEQVSDDPGRFRADFNLPDTLRGRLDFPQDVIIETAYVSCYRGMQIDSLDGPVRMRLTLAKGSKGEVNVKSLPQKTRIEWGIEGEVFLLNDTRIDSVQFLKAENSKSVSSILGGQLVYRETDKPALDSLFIRSGERLYIPTTNPLTLSELALSKEGIFVELEGKLRSLRTLKSEESPVLRNPSVWRWLWHNYRIPLLIVGSFLIIFLAIVLPRHKWEIVRDLIGIFRL